VEDRHHVDPVRALDPDSSHRNERRLCEPHRRRHQGEDHEDPYEAAEVGSGPVFGDPLPPFRQAPIHHAASSKPTNANSGPRSIPVSPATLRRTASINSRTADADAPASASMKLAWRGETRTGPMANPLSPSRSMMAPAASSPEGFLNTDPALSVPPGWWSRRHRVTSFISLADSSGSAVTVENRAEITTSVAATFEWR